MLDVHSRRAAEPLPHGTEAAWRPRAAAAGSVRGGIEGRVGGGGVTTSSKDRRYSLPTLPGTVIAL